MPRDRPSVTCYQLSLHPNAWCVSFHILRVHSNSWREFGVLPQNFPRQLEMEISSSVLMWFIWNPEFNPWSVGVGEKKKKEGRERKGGRRERKGEGGKTPKIILRLCQIIWLHCTYLRKYLTICWPGLKGGSVVKSHLCFSWGLSLVPSIHVR